MSEPLPLPHLDCQRPNCRHRWTPRKPVLPARCPRCWSPYWNMDETKRPRRNVR